MAGFETAQIVSLMVGVVLPLLVGYVTKAGWSGGVRAVTLAFLSAVSGFLSNYLEAGTAFDWRTTFLTMLGTFLIGVGVHFGFWKPVGVTEKVKQAGVKDKVDLAA